MLVVLGYGTNLNCYKLECFPTSSLPRSCQEMRGLLLQPGGLRHGAQAQEVMLRLFCVRTGG